MREIQTSEITDRVAQICQEANFDLGEDVLQALEGAMERETSSLARHVLRQIWENAYLAGKERVPMCQDCGVAVFFVEAGQEVHIAGGNITHAINEGVRKGYEQGYLRKSMVASPLKRVNTGDNTPAIIHFDVVPGDKLRLIFAPKGAGSENMSALRMLKPADGVEGITQFVLEIVKEAGPNPCPPIVVGVGIGGNFETYPCHIGSLPVAVNINCHAARHKELVI
jgi:fumarate hydratase subunit alpha